MRIQVTVGVNSELTVLNPDYISCWDPALRLPFSGRQVTHLGDQKRGIRSLTEPVTRADHLQERLGFPPLYTLLGPEME